jgi:hypothetical protein
MLDSRQILAAKLKGYAILTPEGLAHIISVGEKTSTFRLQDNESVKNFPNDRCSLHWTVEAVQELMPTVRVRFGDGYESEAHLCGRYRDWPELAVKIHGSFLTTTASWETIANCLTLNTPIFI